ncbi:MAG: hypothetical protein ABJD11_18185 [Gemmatimonadota bacterium]
MDELHASRDLDGEDTDGVNLDGDPSDDQALPQDRTPRAPSRQIVLAAREARKDAARLREELTTHMNALEATILAAETARQAAEVGRQTRDVRRGMAELEREGAELRRREHEEVRSHAEELRGLAEMLRAATFEATTAARELRIETDRSRRAGEQQQKLMDQMRQDQRAEEPWKGE